MQAQAVQGSGLHAVELSVLQREVRATGRRKARVRLRVVVRKTVSEVALPGGYVAKPGTHDIDVDIDQVDVAMALVEPHPELLRAAELGFDKELEKLCDEQKGPGWRVDADRERIKREVAKSMGTSVQSIYYMLTAKGPGPMPLVSCEVIEENLPPIDLADPLAPQAQAPAGDPNVAAALLELAAGQRQLAAALAPEPVTAPEKPTAKKG